MDTACGSLRTARERPAEIAACGRATAPALLDQVGVLIAQDTPPHVALEVSQVDFCDSSGINAFVRLWKRAAADGG
ncbi:MULTISPECIES: STAS domain-containing protein [unclassified Spirillospora]|uniref:STAS domain-containing protein n=1 Tax=unclassified Spirillospora TaxID=2642701 RepID=UPI003718CA46